MRELEKIGPVAPTPICELLNDDDFAVLAEERVRDGQMLTRGVVTSSAACTPT